MPILIVEDDEDISSLLRRAFELEGYEVDCARTKDEAVEAANRRAYDTIILDIILPGGSGIEVCRRLRADGPNMSAPIIMLSARDAVPDRVEGLSAGADDYMTKPFAFEELLARVRAQKRRQSPGDAPAAAAKRGVPGLSLNPRLREVELGSRRVERGRAAVARAAFRRAVGRSGRCVRQRRGCVRRLPAQEAGRVRQGRAADHPDSARRWFRAAPGVSGAHFTYCDCALTAASRGRESGLTAGRFYFARAAVFRCVLIRELVITLNPPPGASQSNGREHPPAADAACGR
jgi:DNA-binding response OmpR family regulator